MRDISFIASLLTLTARDLKAIVCYKYSLNLSPTKTRVQFRVSELINNKFTIIIQ